MSNGITYTIHTGDVLAGLAKIESGTVQTCVTSPPYWGLRDYGVDGQIGLEPSPDAYVARMVEVFREVRRCLRDDGTLWLNLGDSYAKAGVSGLGLHTETSTTGKPNPYAGVCKEIPDGFKPKDLCMIPWRVALALQADGWWLRSVIVWAKKSPMPESVTDRPTSSWEPIFLLAKSERYYYDAEAVKEQGAGREKFGNWVNGDPCPDRNDNDRQNMEPTATRNQRNVWHLGPEPYAEAHFATFPTEIPRRCILAGSKPGDLVLDPFAGSFTSGLVALQLGRMFVGCELNPAYVEMGKRRMGAGLRPNTYADTREMHAPLFGVFKEPN